MNKTILSLLAIGLMSLSGGVYLINSSAQTLPNVIEIDPDIPVRLGWDYQLPDANVTGFRIYKKTVVNNVEDWVMVGERSINNTTTALDLFLDLPEPYEGTYSVAAFNPEYESDKSESITFVNKPFWTDIPLAPNNLRVIQVQ